MSLRGFVTGGDACTPSDGSGAGPSNAMAGLANTLLGGSGKQQEQLREVRAFIDAWTDGQASRDLKCHGRPGQYAAGRVQQAAAAALQGA